MTGYTKEPHRAVFTGQTNCGKTHLVLELIEKEYNKNFDFIVIIGPMIRENLPIMQRSGSKRMIMFGL